MAALRASAAPKRSSDPGAAMTLHAPRRPVAGALKTSEPCAQSLRPEPALVAVLFCVHPHSDPEPARLHALALSSPIVGA